MIPVEYAWLDTVGTLPLMVQHALQLLGTTEKPGKASNPTIMSWAEEVGDTKLGYKYTGDDVPWCGLFMAVIAQRAGKKLPVGPLYALNWSSFGKASSKPSLGDVLTFKREGGGHVALYIAEDATAYHVLGGNQSDKVCFTRIEKKRLYKARQVPFTTGLPRSYKPYFMAANGSLSTSEA